MRGGAGLAGAAACWLACAGLAHGQTVTFPASFAREPLLVWLQRETDILPSQVVAVTPQALTSIVSVFPAAGGPGPRVVIRAEALSSEIVARTGAMSWHVSLNADCQGRRVKMGETTGYPERNLLGERKVLRSAEADWRTPEPGTALEHAWRAACDPAFAGPFKSSAVKLAQVDGAAPPPEPARPVAAPAATQPAVAPPPARVVAPPAATARSTPVATPPVATARPRTSGLVAQVGAVSSDADARALFAGLSGRLAGRTTAVETAEVGGRTWRRAVVGGFADGPEAARFCADLRAAGRACFVRPAAKR